MYSVSTVIKMMSITFGGQGTSRFVWFQERDLSTWEMIGTKTILSITNTNYTSTSTNNTIVYRPRYHDYHNSNLAILFFNLEATFPCLSGNNKVPICSLFSMEEDGFLGGRPRIQAADIGNQFRIFSSNLNVKTFGFGISGCLTFATSCVPSYLELALVCLLPRSICT